MIHLSALLALAIVIPFRGRIAFPAPAYTFQYRTPHRVVPFPLVYTFQYRTPYVAAGVTPYSDLIRRAQTTEAKLGYLIELANTDAGRVNQVVRPANRGSALLRHPSLVASYR